MIKSFKYRLYPTASQSIMIDKTLDCYRFLYNLALETKVRAYQDAQIRISSFDLINELPLLKHENSWLKEVSSQVLCRAIVNMEKSFENFFRGSGFPKFKKKDGEQRFQTHNGLKRIDFDKKTLSIQKIYNIPLCIDRKFDGEIKSITISRTLTGKYFASILVNTIDKCENKPFVDSETTIGIDLGLKEFAIASNGLKIENPRHLRRSLKRLKALQRRASRKKRGSNNRKKANYRVAVLHERISNQRKDFLHKVTTNFVSDNQANTFCIENLNVAGMIKNRNLSLSISDVGWAEFVRQMKYKCDWYGKNLIEIGRFEPSSKTCSTCQAINETLILKDREWVCESCGTLHDRDLNAAKNIKQMGLNKHSGKGIPVEPVESRRLRRSKKQELSN